MKVMDERAGLHRDSRHSSQYKVLADRHWTTITTIAAAGYQLEIRQARFYAGRQRDRPDEIARAVVGLGTKLPVVGG